MRQIILDTETTGLDHKQGHRLIEIGAVELVNRRFTQNNLHYYFNPEREVDAGALAVHGLNNAFLADKPRFSQMLDSILDYIQGAELIIHNATFDIGFLEAELKLAKAKIIKVNEICQVTDTLMLARKKHPGQKNSLDALCKRYKIDNSHRNLHGALLDAEILARVYLAMTGGQSTLLQDHFLVEPASMEEKQAKAQQEGAKPYHDYCVQYANATELEAHADFLKLLDKKSAGQVKWIQSAGS